jgi:nitrate/nitrite transporter NarK
VSVNMALVGLTRDVKGNKWGSWLSYNLITFFGTSTIITFGVTASFFSASLHVTPIQVSILASGPLLGVAFICIPATLATRRFGGRIVSCILCVSELYSSCKW